VILNQSYKRRFVDSLDQVVQAWYLSFQGPPLGQSPANAAPWPSASTGGITSVAICA
jgi:hypothetical protein